VFREHAARIMREGENARAAVDDLRGELRIASIQTANMSFLADVVARFRAAHDGIAVRVRQERAAARHACAATSAFLRELLTVAAGHERCARGPATAIQDGPNLAVGSS